MIQNTPLSDQIAASRDSRLRILIIGAGVAGLTLAALLRQRDERPTLIERVDNFDDAGYMLGLYPLGGRVLHGLGVHDEYLATGTPMNTYDFYSGEGELLHSYEIGPFIRRYGDYQGITRGALLNVLCEAMTPCHISFDTTVSNIAQRDEEVEVTFSDGSSATYDLVVGADGLHSDTRDMILNENEYAYWDTGWGGWVTWADADLQASDTYAEYWGAGWFVGLYPVKNRLGVFLGGPADELERVGHVKFARKVRMHMHGSDSTIPAILDTIDAAVDPYFWTFHDCRAERWRSGRVLLLGDAASGFLPTAGVGASMAMDSAAALDDELSRTDAAHLDYALSLYERRQRPAVEAAQENSRRLARMMMLESPVATWGRDQMMRFYSLERALKDIEQVLEGAA